MFAVHLSSAFAYTRAGVNFDHVRDVRSLDSGIAILYWLFYSHYGVDIFFVISGFVISRNFRTNKTLSDYLIFLAHRVVRIYPAFLISLVVTILVALHYSWLANVSLATLLQNLIFLNGAFALNIAAYNGVTWSLFFEFIFYISFPLLYLIAAHLKGNQRRTAPLLWLLFILSLALLSFREWFLMVPFFCGASAGLLAEERLAWLSQKLVDGYLMVAYFVTTTLACTFLPLPKVGDGGFTWPLATPLFVTCLSIIVTLIIVRAAYGDGLLKRLLASAPMLALGRVSYSFFLVHATVLGVVFQLTAPHATGSLAIDTAIALGVFAISVIAATALYEVAEKPYYVFRAYASRRRAAMQAAAANRLDRNSHPE